MSAITIGIDVQVKRHCPYAVLSSTGRVVDSGWISPLQLGREIQRLASQYQEAIFAIDAPRMALPSLRSWDWDRKQGWRPGQGKIGRHCEIVVKALSLANPQWTPLESDAPEWMRLGFQIFEALEEAHRQALEVFPSASYRMLNEAKDVRVDIPLSGFLDGPKDMLDAIVAAMTGHEFVAGRGQEVGGGDRLGTIVLPRRISPTNADVLNWPE
jgi:predicted nuclease with RNAse H fold